MQLILTCQNELKQQTFTGGRDNIMLMKPLGVKNGHVCHSCLSQRSDEVNIC